jgi:hypothetical protein
MTSRRVVPTGIAGLMVASLTLSSPLAHAVQLTIVDVTYTHGADNTSDSHYFVTPAGSIPSNWRAPIDYASGSLHMHVEVMTKPSAERTVWNFCFIGTPNYACTYTPAYTTVGTVESEQRFSTFYQYTQVDWSKRVNQYALILKDDKNVKIAPENVGAARSAQFMPTRVRIVLTLVAPGSIYVPPSSSDGGAIPDAAADGRPDAAGDAAPGAKLDAQIDGSSSDAGAGASRDGSTGMDLSTARDLAVNDASASDSPSASDAEASVPPVLRRSSGCALAGPGSGGQSGSPLGLLLALGGVLAARLRATHRSSISIKCRDTTRKERTT